jgi:DNA-binding transcriptional MerR regulator
MELITVSKAARQLGCSERWIREAENAGKIPKARRNINGWRIFTEEDIKAIRRLIAPSES